MKLLLDTHVWIWSQDSPDKLGPATQQLLTDPEHGNYISAISTLELARLVRMNAIAVSIPLDEWITRSRQALRATSVSVDDRISLEAYSLPEPFHKDPADRMLVGTARVEGLILVTADERILDYAEVRTHDARQ